MGSMFDEMKKVKKHLRDKQSKESNNSDNKRLNVTVERMTTAIRLLHEKQRVGKIDSSLHRSGKSGLPNPTQYRQENELSGYTKHVIQLPFSGPRIVYIRRSGPPTCLDSDEDEFVASSNITATYQLPSEPTEPSQGRKAGVCGGKTIRSFQLARFDEFKLPDDWVSMGGSTTLSTMGRVYSIYMGIDFGTAYTKASVGFGGDIFVVDWSGVREAQQKFTLPGVFSVLNDDSCVLGRCPEAVRIVSEIKLPFLEERACNADLVNATVFLALTMRYIRGWAFYRYSGILSNRSLEWNINLGAPTIPWQNNTYCAKYERIAKAAWRLSVGNTPIDIAQAEQILAGFCNINMDDCTSPPIEVVPEFVAQMASYTRSPQRQSDLHLMVDIGAGTIDVVSFNIHHNDHTQEDRFPIFSASVSNLGTHYLMSRRLYACSQKLFDKWDDASFIPAAHEFSHLTGIDLQKVKDADKGHIHEVANAITSVLRKTRHRRYPLSQKWKQGIRVFLCGGGSLCEVFKQSVCLAERQLGVPLRPISLPLPERLVAPGLPRDQFHRVSVAFGLGMDVANLGHTVSIAEVEDHIATPPERKHYDWDDG